MPKRHTHPSQQLDKRPSRKKPIDLPHFVQNISKKKKILIGWNEWCELPNLKIPAIKAKIDTGAKTSAIHAFDIEPIYSTYQPIVRFNIHPIQNNDKVVIACQAPIIDQRCVTSSTGHKEHRYVIATTLQLGNQSWEIELTLSNRELLRFRMLLGREALKKHTYIDPSKHCIQKTLNKKTLFAYYGLVKK